MTGDGGVTAREARRPREARDGAQPAAGDGMADGGAVTAPAEPAGYQWEDSDADVAAAWGLDPSAIVRFDTNTSPRVPPGLDALIGTEARRLALNEYPDATYARLTAAIAARLNVPASRIVVGAGADEVLDLAAKTCLPAGGRAVLAAPTYAMYRVLTHQRSAGLIEVPRGAADDGFPLDVEAVIRASAAADLLWLCDPDNPTGTVQPDGLIAGLLRRLSELPGGGPVVVVDEAYREFAGASLVPETSRFPRLVVARTVSKAYGLAGIRVGWAVAAEPLAARLSTVRPPGSISSLSAAIAAAALSDDGFARANVAALVDERERLRVALAARGWHVLPSATNFVLLDAGNAAGAEAAARRLLREGLVPRRYAHGPLRAYLRLTVRTPDQDARLVAALGARP